MALIGAFHPNEGRIAVATIAGWNAMEADVSHGVRRERERQRRMVLTPLGWCQVCKDDLRATVTNKVMDTEESAQEPVNTIAQGMPVSRLDL